LFNCLIRDGSEKGRKEETKYLQQILQKRSRDIQDAVQSKSSLVKKKMDSFPESFLRKLQRMISIPIISKFEKYYWWNSCFFH
jgi:hypothetical protein